MVGNMKISKRPTEKSGDAVRLSVSTKKGKKNDDAPIKPNKKQAKAPAQNPVTSTERVHPTRRESPPLSFVQMFLHKQCLERKLSPFLSYQSVQNIILRFASQLYPYKTVSCFDRRVTSLAWHPSWSSILAAGSKSGEIVWWDLNRPDVQQLTIPGVGPGGSITSMKFCKERPTYVYTSSITGKVMLQSFEGKRSECFIDTLTWENWFTSLDVEYRQNLLVTGDTKGYLYLMSSKDGGLAWKLPKRIHKSKISHVEFHPLHPDLLVTASIDHTVKLWDMRRLGDIKDSLCVLQHVKGINSANFSPSSGNLLLTTDQHSELRVFQGPFWDSQITIPHPHRQFQHLTPIKASWHPCMDVIVVGRYPDFNFQPNDKRCIDFLDGCSGELRYQLSNPFTPGIVSLNQFNFTGDVLASGMGFHVLAWKAKDEDEQENSLSSQISKGNKKSDKIRSSGSKKDKQKPKTAGLKKLKTR